MRESFRYVFQVCLGAARGFIKDECFYKASSLTFYTLLSIVPLLAVAFGIATYGFAEYLEAEVTKRLLGQPQLAHQITTFAFSVLEQTHGGWIAFVGLIGLLWASLSLFKNIEYSLNAIWEVKTSRSYTRQALEYLAMLIFFPIFFVVSSGISVVSVAQLKYLSQQSPFVESLSPYIRYFFHAFPFFVNWLLFFFIYIFLPNTKVPWKYAFIAGIAAGTVYQFVEWIYIYFQIGVANYGAVYGSFAALPLFLVWVDTSWIIVLAGAELAYHLEITPKDTQGKLHALVDKKQIVLWITGICTESFLKGGLPVTFEKLARETGASLRVVRQIVSELNAAGILREAGRQACRMARNPDEIKLKDILEAVHGREVKRYSVKSSPKLQSYTQSMNELDSMMANSPANISLRDLSKRG